MLSIKQIAEHLKDRLQRRQQCVSQLQPETLRLDAQLGDRVVELIRSRREVLAHLVGELLHAGRAFIQQRDQVSTSLAKQCHCCGRLLRTIRHVSKAIGDLLQRFVSRHYLTIGILNVNAECLKLPR